MFLEQSLQMAQNPSGSSHINGGRFGCNRYYSVHSGIGLVTSLLLCSEAVGWNGKNFLALGVRRSSSEAELYYFSKYYKIGLLLDGIIKKCFLIKKFKNKIES